MEYRALGRTGLKVSAVSLGTEYLLDVPAAQAAVVVRQAIDRGVNYFDVFWPQPAFRDKLGKAFKGCRDQILLAAHLGAALKQDQYTKTRNVKLAGQFLHDFLKRYHTDHADILFLHNSDGQADYDRIFGDNGLADLAESLKREGKARFIGFSGHTAGTARQAAENGRVDVVMYPVNLASHAASGKDGLLKACVRTKVGLVAMKPFAGGKLFAKTHQLYFEKWQAGQKKLKLKKTGSITPAQCLSYVLSQAGVSCAVPGCKNKKELSDVLRFWDTAEGERDFAPVLAGFDRYKAGECVYCNHCLPCPARIDIGMTIRLAEAAETGLTDDLKRQYRAMATHAGDCTACGACSKRCPFGVAVEPKLKRAVELFGR